MIEKVLFISNHTFLDITKPEGGVRFCTFEFIKMLRCVYEVELFALTINRSFLYRLKAKLGIDIYEDYNEQDYGHSLLTTIQARQIDKVFINLANASSVAHFLRKNLQNRVQLILCSHGNESGDFLHQSVRFPDSLSFVQQKTAPWRLGKILQKELMFRVQDFDLVLTVSEIEAAIEKWMGAVKVLFVPTVFNPEYLPWNPIIGRIGFIGDVSHYPNYFGLQSSSSALNTHQVPIQLRVVGKPCDNLTKLQQRFPFVQPLGYLEGEQLQTEMGSWMFFLNLVFYYSKGVSTKLARGMNAGLPVVSTEAGNRGYALGDGICTFTDAQSMASFLAIAAFDVAQASLARERVLAAVENFKEYKPIAQTVCKLLER